MLKVQRIQHKISAPQNITTKNRINQDTNGFFMRKSARVMPVTKMSRH